MTITGKTVQFALSVILAIGSIFLFGDGLRLIAEWRVDVGNGIFMSVAGLLGTLVFVYRAQDAKQSWPISITKSR